MKVVTLNGTFEIDLSEMKVVRPNGSEAPLDRVPSPVVGERMDLNGESTEQVVKIEP
jgi:hypothetical protein